MFNSCSIDDISTVTTFNTVMHHNKLSFDAFFLIFSDAFFMYNIIGIIIPNAGNNAPARNGRAPCGNDPDPLLLSYNIPENL